MSDYEFRPYRLDDEHAILATFNRVFAADAGRRPRSLEEWRWAYSDNPAGLRVWLALDGATVAAHYASLPNRTRVEGETRVFAQIVDTMVHPDYRRGLKKPGLFVETARRMLAATCGPDKDLVTYGWPTREAWRTGKAFLDYEMVRRESALYSELDGVDPTLPAGVVRALAFPESVARLYERCAAEWGASTIRDRAWLQWRVFARPGQDYRVLTVPDAAGALLGYAVLRTTDWPIPGACVLCDWLVPSDDRETGERLLAAVRSDARAGGAAAVLALFPQWSPWFLHFQERGFLVTSTEYFMSGRNNHPRHDMFWLRDNWWYQPLDLDLF